MQTHLNISQVGSRMEICSQLSKTIYYLLGFDCIRDATGLFCYVVIFPPPFSIKFMTNYRKQSTAVI